MSAEQYAAMPGQITVRKLKIRGRILVTTLIKPRTAPRAELAWLYQ